MYENEHFTRKAQQVLDQSLREALQLGYNRVGPEHILLAIARHGDNLGAQALHDESEAMTYESLRRRIRHLAEAERAAWLPPSDARDKEKKVEKDPVSDLLGSLNNALPLLGKMGGAVLEDLAARLKKL